MPDGPRYDDDFYAVQSLPRECRYTVDQVLAEDWYPEAADSATGEAE
jgi:hypothetical protein